MSKPHGHYCRICQQYKANEKFSGRGHATHICKACAKRGNKPPEIHIEPPVFIDVENIDDYYIFDGDIDSIAFPVDEEPPKKKKKRKPSKEKLLRAAQKKQAKAFLQRILANGEMTPAEAHKAAASEGISVVAQGERLARNPRRRIGNRERLAAAVKECEIGGIMDNATDTERQSITIKTS
jgi:hypothetical protein